MLSWQLHLTHHLQHKCHGKARGMMMGERVKWMGRQFIRSLSLFWMEKVQTGIKIKK
jgi:hypothetical protein